MAEIHSQSAIALLLAEVFCVIALLEQTQAVSRLWSQLHDAGGTGREPHTPLSALYSGSVLNPLFFFGLAVGGIDIVCF